jgi:uncharacterized protein (TIGR02646 family)
MWNEKCLECDDLPGAPKLPRASKLLRERKHEQRSLADWFHDLVRPDAPHVCAYCDATLREQSPPTIDHFVPQSACQVHAFAWANLYPACVTCNSKHKGARYEPGAARPDLDPVDEWFDIDPETGRLDIRAELLSNARAAEKVRLAISLFGLNADGRPQGGKRVMDAVMRARLRGDVEHLDALLQGDHYRFVADAAKRAPL